jgi:hypothetical protein
MRGVSLPELQRFSALCAFLGLNCEQVCDLLWADADKVARGSKSGNGKGVPANIRSALQELLEHADEEALSAAYLAFLMATRSRTPMVRVGLSLPESFSD